MPEELFATTPPIVHADHEAAALIRDHKMGVLRGLYSSALFKVLIGPIRTVCIYKSPGR